MRDMASWLGLAALIVVVDQASKYAVVAYFATHPPVAVTSFFNLVLVHNPGGDVTVVLQEDQALLTGETVWVADVEMPP